MGYKRSEALDALEKYDYDLDKVSLGVNARDKHD